jgi:hypothetical protein
MKMLTMKTARALLTALLLAPLVDPCAADNTPYHIEVIKGDKW